MILYPQTDLGYATATTSADQSLVEADSVRKMAPAIIKTTDPSRAPLKSLNKYPKLIDQDPFHTSDMIKPSEVSSGVGKPIIPPKPVPSSRNIPWRPRTSSTGSVPTNSRPTAAQSRLLEQPYPIERSISSQSKFRSLENQQPRARSYSSSSVGSATSTSSTSSQQQKRESFKTLASSLAMRRDRYGETHPKVGSAWNRLGNYFFRSCQYNHALESYKHAVACYKVGEPELGCAFSNMGTVLWASGRPDLAFGFLEKALEVYELNEITEGGNLDESLAVASTLYQMGLCNTLRKQYGEALSCLKKCQKIQAALLPARDIQMGRTLDAIGKVHFFKEEYSTALQCHEEARRIKSASGDDESAVITSLMNIAAVHHATRNWNVALSKYTKVMHLQQSDLVRCRNQKGHPLRARAAQDVGETLQLMGDMHRHMNQEDQAMRFYNEALLVYQEAGLAQDDPRMLALKQ